MTSYIPSPPPHEEADRESAGVAAGETVRLTTPATTEDEGGAPRARLIYAKSNVSRANQIGFLCLVSLLGSASSSLPSSEKRAFVWIAKDNLIQSADLAAVRNIAKQTKALFGPNPPPSPISPTINETPSHSLQPPQTARSPSPLDFFFGTSQANSATPSTTTTTSPTKKPSSLSIRTSPTPQASLAATATTYDIALPASALVSRVAHVHALAFAPRLAVAADGGEACLVRMVIRVLSDADRARRREERAVVRAAVRVLEGVRTIGGDAAAGAPVAAPAKQEEKVVDEEDEEDDDVVWFEQDEDGKEGVVLEKLVGEMHVWLSKACGKGLQPVFSDEDDAQGMLFRVLNLKDLKGEDGRVVTPVEAIGGRRGAWPVPVSEGSAMYKIGSFGVGVLGTVAAAIVGTGVTNKAEELARNVAWDAMDQFSKVTKFAQDTTRQVVEHPLARPVLPLIPTPLRDMLLSSEEAEQLMSEYDSASLYLGAFADSLHTRVARARLYQRRPAASDGALDTSREFEALRARWGGLPARTLGRRVEGEEWVLLFDERGRITLGEEAVREMLYARGVSGECRREVWKFLLDVYTWDGEEVERVQSLRVRRAQYESLRRQWVGILEMAGAAAEFEQVASPVKGLPLGSGFGGVGADANTAVGDEKIEGDVVSKIKERKARVEKDVVRTDRGVPFFQGSPDDNNILLISPTSPRFKTAHLSTNLEALKNVLMTYTLYNFDLGYVQGMNDLCSPILAVMDGDEVEAFWSFVGFMEKRKGNFSRDQSGMHGQLKSLEMLIRFVDPFLWLHLDRIDSTNLFCCFRWILIVFKREFKFEQILTLWEAMWACPFTKNFHIFVALAILNKHRSAIMKTCTAFDEALKFVNDLSETHDVEDIIQRAEVLFRVFQQQLTQAMREQEGIDMATGAAVVPSPIATEGKLHAGGEGRGLSPASSRAALTADTREGGKSLSRASSRSTVGDNGVRGVSPSPQGVGVFTLDQLIELAELLEKE